MGGRERRREMKILVIYYSQSGQLKQVLDNFLKPIVSQGEHKVWTYKIEPVEDFPFPWSPSRFIDVFPEAVTETPCKLKEFPEELMQKYDLIVLGWQAWYLSPSIPISSFLQSEAFKKLVYGTKVVSINASRNMWFKAHKSVRKYLQEAQAQHIGHLAFFDKENNLLSVVSIMHWAYTAKKERKWGVFPKPGVSDEDIASASRFGEIFLDKYKQGKLEELQSSFVENKGVIIYPHIMSMEHKGKRMFKIWTKFVLKKGEARNPNRYFRLQLFKYYLLVMLYVFSPIVMAIFYITCPFFFKRINRHIKEYQQV